MFSDLVQHLVNGLVMGAVVALPALGLTLIFSVLGFINFSIAAQMTVGAYGGWLVNTHLHWPLVPVLVAAFALAGLVGWWATVSRSFPCAARSRRIHR
ncbi:hypothetical protein L3V85_00155 [Variovorax paradoxus]|nr:hypothetical protein [Variovorax paradoxus]UKI08316.1 hypothetical protein L3V85_00155 [Variovorax paradoxus]